MQIKVLSLFSAAIGLTLVSCDRKQAVHSAPQSLNPGEALVQQSIAAHGGIEGWRSNGLLQFRWQYHMLDKGVVVDSTQVVDPISLAVTHTVPNSEVRFGLNQGTAWIYPAEADFIVPPRFWALTPTYFVGIPFVFDDQDACFEKLEEFKEFEGKDYLQVKITYPSTSGDSPDDYYVLLIDPDTKITRGVYYIVTHPLVAPNGPTPEKFLTLDSLKDVSGLLLPEKHRTFTMEEGQIGSFMRRTEVSNLGFLPKGSIDLSMPEGAKEL